MTKTESQIERDFYALIKSSVLGKEIKGEVYRSEMRPYDATTEDIVVKFLAGEDEQIQTGVLIVNIYVNDKTGKDGRNVIDHSRVAKIEESAIKFVESCDDAEYLITTDGSMVTYPIDGIRQHQISMRLKFQRLNA